MTAEVAIVEVGLRDGFQSIGPFIPTASKIRFLKRLVAAGITRAEIGSFVSAAAVPQMSDTPEILTCARQIDGLVPQVLVPTFGQAIKALDAGSDFLSFVISVSPAHSQSNVRRSPQEAASDYVRLVGALRERDKIRLNVATAFDCPFEGRVKPEAVIDLLAPLVAVLPNAEIALCDTTGRANPAQVDDLFRTLQLAFGPETVWAFHGHDTYGLGLLNCYVAYQAGVRVFDAAIAGLGGCPFAPGATGNVATEDLINMFHGLGISTACDLNQMVGIAQDAARIPGAQVGGRLRQALSAAQALENPNGGICHG